VKIVSISTAAGSCSRGRTIVCKLGAIASGASSKITIVAQPTVTGQLRNSASVTSPTPDPDSANDLAHVTTDVRPGPAGLRLTKTASRRIVRPGDAFSSAIAVRSLGPEPGLAVKVCDQLGSRMAFISAHGATFHDGSPCWTISSLAHGRLRRLLVRLRAPNVRGPRLLTNFATAGADGVRTRLVRASVELVGQPAAPPGDGVTG
jgi:uncharacterized repeat protein (TIGR01451 family)